MTGLATQAKNRLQAVLQRHHLVPPAGNLFHELQQHWWLALPLGTLEKVNVQSDLETLRFAQAQQVRLTSMMEEIASQQEQATRLLQIPGFGVVTAVTVWAAIGDIQRFADPQHLVAMPVWGHESMPVACPRVLDGLPKRADVICEWFSSRQRRWQPTLIRTGRQNWLGWKRGLGRNKAIVAIAHKLLVTVWYILAQHKADRFAEPEQVAQKLLKFAYQLGKENRPTGQSAAQFRSSAFGCSSTGKRADLHRLGLEETDPTAPSANK